MFLQPVVTDLELTRTAFGLTIAIQNLIWGVAQPFAGMLADKYGSFRVLILSSLLYIAGLVLTATTSSATGLHLSLGMLVGLAMSGTTFTVVLSAVGRLVAPEKRSLAFGIVSAGGVHRHVYLCAAGPVVHRAVRLVCRVYDPGRMYHDRAAVVPGVSAPVKR